MGSTQSEPTAHQCWPGIRSNMWLAATGGLWALSDDGTVWHSDAR